MVVVVGVVVVTVVVSAQTVRRDCVDLCVYFISRNTYMHALYC